MCIYNGAEGAFVRDGAMMEISGSGHFDNNGTTGIYCIRARIFGTTNTANAITAKANGLRNVSALDDGHVSLTNADLNTAGGAPISAFASIGSQIFLTTCSNLVGLSPAAGTVGNNNSYLQVF